MTEEPTEKSDFKNHEEEINLTDIFFILWNGKLTIFLVTSIISISAVLYSISLPNIYTSQTTVASASGSGNSLSSIASQYSGLASIAGISMPSSSEVDQMEMGIEIIRSYSFFKKFISQDDLFFLLLAVNGWDESKNTLIIDDDIYDTTSDKWISEKRFSVDGVPSLQTAHRAFLESLSISKDPKKGFVEISFDHYSPHVAQNFIRLLVFEINDKIRQEEIAQAEESIKFLEQQILGTQLAEVRISLNELLQSQVETIMIANSTPEYLFKTLSPPIAPEMKSKPSRSAICIISFLLGGLLGCIIVLTQSYIRQFPIR